MHKETLKFYIKSENEKRGKNSIVEERERESEKGINLCSLLWLSLFEEMNLSNSSFDDDSLDVLDLIEECVDFMAFCWTIYSIAMSEWKFVV